MSYASFTHSFATSSTLRLSKGILHNSRLFSSYSNVIEGTPKSKSYRVYFADSNKKRISPWHDIPIRNNPEKKNIVNFVCEIPKFTSEKFEINTKELHTPICQDIKKDKLRNYHGPIYWNYGCIPQTWENPSVKHPVLDKNGDNDPLDVVEVGSSTLPSGTVAEVKVLGVLAMIDSGELDWKVIAINKDDPLEEKINSIDDLEKELPHTISGIREWFRWYKTPDGKPLNTFGYDGKVLDQDETIHVIEETHQYWKDLVSGKIPNGELSIK